ncbi:MAG: NADH dehydrogenase subunit G [bacterium ADurb.Bin243]|nr:MAG: NADH dehydrogenase subunit G [bacterium ADurb.Bin243]
MCDYGRLFRKHINSENRMTAPVIKNNRKDASSVTTEESYEKAFVLIGERLASVLKNDGAKRAGVLISPYLSVEEAYIILKTFYEAGSNHIALIDCGEGIDGFSISDDYLISKDKSPNKAGILELAKKIGVNFIKPETLASAAGTKKIGALIFAGPPFGMSEYYEKNKAELDSADFILSLSSHFQAPASRSDAAIPFSLWCESEGHFVNKQNMVQHYGAAVNSPAKGSPDNIQLLCRLASLFKVKLDYRSSGEVYNDIKNKLHLFE